MNRQLKTIRDSLNGVCQLCGRVSIKTLHLDHNHDTLLARGFVCSPCNTGAIPTGERVPELVSQKVLDYLSNPPLAYLKCVVPNVKDRTGLTKSTRFTKEGTIIEYIPTRVAARYGPNGVLL